MPLFRRPTPPEPTNPPTNSTTCTTQYAEPLSIGDLTRELDALYRMMPPNQPSVRNALNTAFSDWQLADAIRTLNSLPPHEYLYVNPLNTLPAAALTNHLFGDLTMSTPATNNHFDAVFDAARGTPLPDAQNLINKPGFYLIEYTVLDTQTTNVLPLMVYRGRTGRLMLEVGHTRERICVRLNETGDVHVATGYYARISSTSINFESASSGLAREVLGLDPSLADSNVGGSVRVAKVTADGMVRALLALYDSWQPEIKSHDLCFAAWHPKFRYTHYIHSELLTPKQRIDLLAARLLGLFGEVQYDSVCIKRGEALGLSAANRRVLPLVRSLAVRADTAHLMGTDAGTLYSLPNLQDLFKQRQRRRARAIESVRVELVDNDGREARDEDNHDNRWSGVSRWDDAIDYNDVAANLRLFYADDSRYHAAFNILHGDDPLRNRTSAHTLQPDVRVSMAMDRISTWLENEGLDEDLLPIRSDCGHWHTRHTQYTLRTGRYRTMTVCADCEDEYARTPADHDDLWHSDHLHWSENYQDYYTYDIDEEEREQEEDEEDDECDAIRSYSSDVVRSLGLPNLQQELGGVPTPYSRSLLTGVELEVDAGDYEYSPASCASIVLDRLGRDYAIAKSDGSLSSRGFEIVTAPRALTTHIKKFGEMSWPSGMKAWDAGCCGMHVHIDSRHFTELQLGRFMIFMNSEANAQLIRRVAGRHPSQDSQARSYAQVVGASVLVNPAQAKKSQGYDRYRIVNLTTLSEEEAERLGVEGSFGHKCRGASTVEVRIFRATLKKERLLAQLEFVDASVRFCLDASNTRLTAADFTAWLTPRTKTYPALGKWLGLVKVKANTPAVTETADV